MRKLMAALTLVVGCAGLAACGPSKEARQAAQQKADVAREIKAVSNAPNAPVATNN